MKRVCQTCGTTYETKPSAKPKYCSHQCYANRTGGSYAVTCPICGKQVKSYPSEPRTYCSQRCAMTARNLSDANPSYYRDVSGEKNPMYGKGRSGPLNPMYGRRKEQNAAWRGGRKVRKDGYILVYAPDDHPYASSTKPGGTRYVLEHRLVMERKIGRYLRPEEVVHHLDHNPSNNHPDNLVLYANQRLHISEGHAEQNLPPA